MCIRAEDDPVNHSVISLFSPYLLSLSLLEMLKMNSPLFFGSSVLFSSLSLCITHILSGSTPPQLLTFPCRILSKATVAPAPALVTRSPKLDRTGHVSLDLDVLPILPTQLQPRCPRRRPPPHGAIVNAAVVLNKPQDPPTLHCYCFT